MYDAGPPRSRTEFVLNAIRAGIVNGDLPPGRPLVEAELAAGFGVSKTPVREALKLLGGSGLVTISDYKGVSVREVDVELVRSVYDVRVLLEPEALRRSVDGQAGEGWESAREALEEAEKAGSPGARSLANRAFHRALYVGCRNPLLVEVLDGLSDRTALISTVGWGQSDTWASEAQEHRMILDAAERGHGLIAADLLREHIERFARAFEERCGGR
ncbi:DNA-binding GntR family transcriptional regulator [Saccharothrix variisporea]|uniref:DNA-binding GntR family transcriptional regulator n=2 Tax=Saccharothrix variisporea TaxID=543527 RepID=A0A495XHX0_9PSEU|nr:DNA-binding GntR family transcriptional regulator [Saccharothrix variisporea]